MIPNKTNNIWILALFFSEATAGSINVLPYASSLSQEPGEAKRYIHLKPVLKALNDWNEKATIPCKHGLCTVWKKCLQASASINVFSTQRKFGPFKVLWPVQWTRWVLSGWHLLWTFWKYTSVAVVTQPECMTVCAMLCTLLEQVLTDSSQTEAL